MWCDECVSLKEKESCSTGAFGDAPRSQESRDTGNRSGWKVVLERLQVDLFMMFSDFSDVRVYGTFVFVYVCMAQVCRCPKRRALGTLS